MNAALQCLAAVRAVNQVIDDAVTLSSGNLVAAFHEHLCKALDGAYVSLAPTCLKARYWVSKLIRHLCRCQYGRSACLSCRHFWQRGTQGTMGT